MYHRDYEFSFPRLICIMINHLGIEGGKKSRKTCLFSSQTEVLVNPELTLNILCFLN